MFVLKLTYIKGIKEVEKLLTAHRAYLDKNYASHHFLASGPQVPRTGGMILCVANNREEVDSIIAEDPFLINGVADYDIIEFVPRKHVAELNDYLKDK